MAESGQLVVIVSARNVPDGLDIAPRLRQVLRGFLAGKSEKEVARSLGISQHTVHVYCKQLYTFFGVSSRAELLARWIEQDGRCEAWVPAPGEVRTMEIRRPSLARDAGPGVEQVCFFPGC